MGIREVRRGSNTDVYYFGYLLNRAISRKKNIILSRGILVVKGQR